MVTHDFNTAILQATAHRPWSMPERPWVMTQTWHHLLFAHWPIDVRALKALLPAAFEVDLFDGEAWIGVVPFYMTNVAPRGVPSLPWVSEFPELNVRTYVRVGDRPGVYFFSLDAGSAIAVRMARAFLNLPYYRASMKVGRRGDAIDYESHRIGAHRPARFIATYSPAGDRFHPTAGSLEYFLTERYCLYHIDRRGAPYRLEIHHPPWLLQTADADITRNTVAEASGLAVSDAAPLLHFVKRQDMVAWAPASVVR